MNNHDQTRLIVFIAACAIIVFMNFRINELEKSLINNISNCK